MTTQPSLPAVIGATENALRELLLTASLIEGMNEADVAATRRVLATVRDRAEALVAAQAANDR